MNANRRKKDITIVDFSTLFYRATLTSQLSKLSFHGETTGGLFNLIRSYNKLIREYKNVVMCFDKNTISKRKELDNKYKSTRDMSKTLKDLGIQDIKSWKEDFLFSMPHNMVYHNELEADDVIASFVSHILKSCPEFTDIKVVTLDSDLWALKEDRVDIINLKNDWLPVSSDDIEKKFGLNNPKKIFWHKCIFGDHTDNIEKCIPPRTRKQQFIDFINNSNVDETSNIDEFKKTLISRYDNIDAERLSTNISLVTLVNNKQSELVMEYYEGSPTYYDAIKSHYGFNNVPSFEEVLKNYEANSYDVNASFFQVERFKAEDDAMDSAL